jgi:hypothetical protein
MTSSSTLPPAYVAMYGRATLHILTSGERTACGRDSSGMGTDVTTEAAVCRTCERVTADDAPTLHTVTVDPVTLPQATRVTPSGKGLRAVGARIADDMAARTLATAEGWHWHARADVTADGRRSGIPTGMRLTGQSERLATAHIVATRDARGGRDGTAALIAIMTRAARRPIVRAAVLPRTGQSFSPAVTRWLNRPTEASDTMHGAMLYRRGVNTSIVQRMAARLNRPPMVFAPAPVADESREILDRTAARFPRESYPLHDAHVSAHRADERAARLMAEYMRERRAASFRETRERATWEATETRRLRVLMNRAVFRSLESRVATMTFLDERPSDASNIWAAVVARTFLPSLTSVPADARPFFYWTRNVAARAASEAFVNVRGDHLRIQTEHDDVMNLARELAATRMLELLTDVTATACDGTCGQEACAADAARADTHRMMIDGTADVIGWHATREVACGECGECAAHGTCIAKRPVPVWLPVARIVGASVKGAARRVFPTDKRAGVEWFSQMSERYGYDAADAMTTEVHDAGDTAAIAPQTRAMMRLIAETLNVTGTAVIAANGQWSTEAGDVAALAYGYELSPRGRRSARARLIAENVAQ